VKISPAHFPPPFVPNLVIFEHQSLTLADRKVHMNVLNNLKYGMCGASFGVKSKLFSYKMSYRLPDMWYIVQGIGHFKYFTFGGKH